MLKMQSPNYIDKMYAQCQNIYKVMMLVPDRKSKFFQMMPLISHALTTSLIKIVSYGVLTEVIVQTRFHTEKKFYVFIHHFYPYPKFLFLQKKCYEQGCLVSGNSEQTAKVKKNCNGKLFKLAFGVVINLQVPPFLHKKKHKYNIGVRS